MPEDSPRSPHCRLRVLNDVVLNQVLVSFGDPDTTQRVIDKSNGTGLLVAADQVEDRSPCASACAIGRRRGGCRTSLDAMLTAKRQPGSR